MKFIYNINGMTAWQSCLRPLAVSTRNIGDCLGRLVALYGIQQNSALHFSVHGNV